MKKLLLYTLLLTFSFSVSGQGRPGGKGSWTGKLSGVVQDSAGKHPLEFATVQLLNKEKKIVTGSVTDTKGKFFIDSVKAGVYSLEVVYMGYYKKTITNIVMSPKEDVLIKELPTILLVSKSKTTKTVTVTKKKPVMVNEIDRKVFNADQDLTSQGGTAMDLMQNVPSIEISDDGTISLRGNSNVIILIDGRPSGLTGASRQAFLDGIPASSIEKIEIITNPSAKFDPDGMSGIINIILKKNKRQGYNGMVSLTLGTNDNHNGAATIGYRDKKYNIYGNYSINNRIRNSDREYEKITFVNNEYLRNEGTREGNNLNHLVKVGADYYLNQLNTLYFSANTGFGSGKNEGNSLFNYTDPNWNTLSLIRRLNDENRSNNSFDVNAGWTKKYNKKGQELSFDAFYSQGSRADEESIEQGTYNAVKDNYLDQLLLQTLETSSGSKIYSFKLDYTKPLKNNMKLETGTKVNLRTIENGFYVENFDSATGVYIPDATLNNDFQFNEDIYAVYGILGKTINKFGFQAGLRIEQALTKSEVTSENDGAIKNDYFSLFPSAHIKYNLTPKKEFLLSYSRRVNRPRTRQLNPFANSTDPEKVFSGNPYLTPEFINSYEFGYAFYNKKYNFTSTVYLRELTDMISRIKTTDSSGLSAVTYDNFDRSTSYGFELVSGITLTDNWRVNISGNANASKFSDAAEQSTFDNSSFRWSVKLMSSWSFKENHSVQLSGSYRAPFDIAQGYLKEMYGFDLAYKLKVMKGKGSIGLRITDVLNTRKFGYHTEDTFIYDVGSHKWQSQNAFVSFSYNFGNQQKQRNRNSGGFQGGGDMGM